MRILQTAATYAPSLDGVAEVVRNVSERLAKRGHEVHVATTAIDSEGSYVRLHGVHIHRFAAKGNLSSAMYGEIQKYREFVRSGRWDLVVNHCLQIWTSDALLSDLGSYSWPSILVTHGLSGFGKPAFRDYYDSMVEHFAEYAAWITVTESGEEKWLAQEHQLEPPRVITNGVDMDEWSRPTLNLRQKWGIGDAPWMVNVSNHNPSKDHRTIFQLTEHLNVYRPRVTLVGGTYPMSTLGLGNFGVRGGCFYECSMRALTSRLVELRTAIPRAEVVSALQEADLVVSTSKWEANSLVLLESMAAGTPWVSFDVGSARENTGGIVVRNLHEMAEAVIELLRDPERRRALGNSGRARAAAKHDFDRIADQYERLCINTVGRKTRQIPIRPTLDTFRLSCES